MRKIKLFTLCLAIAVCLTGCGSKSDLKTELGSAALSGRLPDVGVTGCRYLSEADDEVYHQQLAACELYYEAYDLTRTADFREKYEDSISLKRIASYCNDRRSELNLEISTQLHDNVYDMIRSVADCENTKAYVDRVDEDAFGFFDYYAEYRLGEDKADALCTILKTFYERSNVLAFRFMAEHKEEFLGAATLRIINNSVAKSDYNMYITENNELIKALNTVYGGVNSEFAYAIKQANSNLIRNMLEEDNTLDEESINRLMAQLGEPMAQ